MYEVFRQMIEQMQLDDIERFIEDIANCEDINAEEYSKLYAIGLTRIQKGE